MTGRLADWTVLIPRGGVWGAELGALLTDEGATAVIAPLIAFSPPEDEAALRAAIDRLAAGVYDWLVITSATTVDALARLGAVVPPGTRIGVVGEHTARAARDAGFAVDFLPVHDHSARGLVAEWPDRVVAGDEDRSPAVLLPQSELADETLLEGLGALGLDVERVTAYRTVGVRPVAGLAERVAEGAFDAILVTAGSVAARAADEFPVIAERTRIVCIGPRTAGEAATVGLRVSAVSVGRSGSSMVETLVELARGRKDPE